MSTEKVECGIIYYISLIASIGLFAIFMILQYEGAEYKNWQDSPRTKQYIQVASICAVISFVGFNIATWSVYGILSPIMITSGCIFVLSLLIVITSFW
ncbi:hypothetical protein BDB01DRAFT_773090 [Pilobolus umbonatus]|nr:hypothetical protein BDB01DRAFT_773090 [Pilobolus umbonatus]